MLDLDPAHNDASTLLDGLRFLASQACAVGHALAFWAPVWAPGWLAGALGSGSVCVFFILSGFVISHSLRKGIATESDYDFITFMSRRFARIYTGLTLCLLFIAVVDLACVCCTSYQAGDLTAGNFIGCLLSLQGRPIAGTGVLGTGTPLWTLSIEEWLYFSAGWWALVAWRREVPGVVALAGGGLGLVMAFGGMHAGYGLGHLWLAGALVQLVIAEAPGPANGWRLLGWCGAWLMFAPAGFYHVLAYVALFRGFHELVPCGLVSQRLTSRPIARAAVRWAAGYSYTLYLVHHTVMSALRALAPGVGITGALIISNGISIVLARYGERRGADLRRWLEQQRASTLDRQSRIIPREPTEEDHSAIPR